MNDQITLYSGHSLPPPPKKIKLLDLHLPLHVDRYYNNSINVYRIELHA